MSLFCLPALRVCFLQFDWQGPRVGLGPPLLPRLGEAKVVNVGPSCARGDWSPATPPPVRVAAYGSTAVFAAAGCVEVFTLEEQTVWSHVGSLPASLDLADGDKLVPSAFGRQVAVGDGVMAVSAAVRSLGKEVPAVAVYVSLSRTEWVLAEVIKCDTESCEHKPQPCSTPGSFPGPDESPGCLGGGFAASVAIQGQLLALGIPNNSSVVLYKQQSIGGEFDSAAVDLGDRVGIGGGLGWKFKAVFTGPESGAADLAFGASIAMNSGVMVVGFPSLEPAGGALVFSTYDGSSSAAHFGELLLDVREQCCVLELPCCQSAFAGRAVDTMLQATTARLVVGDPANSAAVLVDCDIAQLQASIHSSSTPVCEIASYVTAPKSGAAAADAHKAGAAGRGLGASVAIGGDVVFLGNPSSKCNDAPDSASGECGQVCHAACCPPGSCLLYDWGVEDHVCLSCSDERTCRGGIEVSYAFAPVSTAPFLFRPHAPAVQYMCLTVPFTATPWDVSDMASRARVRDHPLRPTTDLLLCGMGELSRSAACSKLGCWPLWSWGHSASSWRVAACASSTRASSSSPTPLNSRAGLAHCWRSSVVFLAGGTLTTRGTSDFWVRRKAGQRGLSRVRRRRVMIL